MKHYIKRCSQRLKISLLKKFEPNKYVKTVTETESQVISIFRKLIKQKDTILFISPISNKRYLKNIKLKIFMVIESHNVSIINHVYGYDISINTYSYNKIINLFDIRIDNDICLLESQYNNNIKYSLNDLNNKINKYDFRRIQNSQNRMDNRMV
jgi:hypothetical protein